MIGAKKLLIAYLSLAVLAGCGEEKTVIMQSPPDHKKVPGEGSTDDADSGGATSAADDVGSGDPDDSGVGESDDVVQAPPDNLPIFCEGLEGPVLGETPMGSFFNGELQRTSTGSYEGVVLVRPETLVGYFAYYSVKIPEPYQVGEIAVYDRRDCKPIVADSLGRVFHQVQYTRRAGEDPGVVIRAESSDAVASVPFELKVAPASVFKYFCIPRDHYDAIELGQIVEGRLDPAVDEADGPEGYALRVYTVELERGQVIDVDYEHLGGERAQIYIFDGTCRQEFPSQAYDRVADEYEASRLYFTVSQNTRYFVLVNATGPGDSEYRLTLSAR